MSWTAIVPHLHCKWLVRPGVSLTCNNIHSSDGPIPDGGTSVFSLSFGVVDASNINIYRSVDIAAAFQGCSTLCVSLKTQDTFYPQSPEVYRQCLALVAAQIAAWAWRCTILEDTLFSSTPFPLSLKRLLSPGVSCFVIVDSLTFWSRFFFYE